MLRVDQSELLKVGILNFLKYLIKKFLFSRCYLPNYGQYCEFQIDCINLEEKIYELPNQKRNFDSACVNFTPNACKKIAFNQISKFILDNLSS
jgi:hypothetical protein